MKIAFVDIETGGLEPSRPITQIAAVVVDHNWAELTVMEEKIRFDEAEADPAALELTGYSAERWAHASPIDVALHALARGLRLHLDVEMTSKKPPFRPYKVITSAGHNPRFDHERLRAAAKDADVFLALHPRALDTCQLACWLLPGLPDYKLGTVCKYLGIPEGGHDALGDARASVQIAKVLLERAAVSHKKATR
jgi:DNA polymerase III epsilon subunit-like protein